MYLKNTNASTRLKARSWNELIQGTPFPGFLKAECRPVVVFLPNISRLALYFWVLFFLLGSFPLAFAQQAEKDSMEQQSLKNLPNNEKPLTEKLEKKSIFPQKSPRGAVIRAAVFPGWGQWYNEKKFKAFLVLGTEIGFVSTAIWHNQRVVTPLDESAGTYTEEYKESYKDFHINMRNQFVWYLAGAILYSMADAYVDAHLFEFDESPDLSAFLNGISVNFLADSGVMLSYQKSF